MDQAEEAHTMEEEPVEEAQTRVEVQMVEHRSRAEEEMHVRVLATLEIMEEAVVKMSVVMKRIGRCDSRMTSMSCL